ncbi:trypsin-like serine protease [Pontiella sp.]|uniref:trypsin-like serine protease n=1 Tax=Pontiella sp. TaxID=2837462 RepID=UPI00356603FA
MIAGVLCGVGAKARAIAVSDYAVAEEAPSNTTFGAGFDWSFVYSYRDATAVAVDHYWILTAAHVADDVTSHVKSNLTVNGETYYQQEVVFHPTAGAWNESGGWIHPASTQTVVSVAATASNCFYRIRVELD